MTTKFSRFQSVICLQNPERNILSSAVTATKIYDLSCRKITSAQPMEKTGSSRNPRKLVLSYSTLILIKSYDLVINEMSVF
jgi:hypothetical protein